VIVQNQRRSAGAACDELKKAHVKVEFIEGPSGDKIDMDTIEQYCRSQSTRAE
jgi:hypothetical protein